MITRDDYFMGRDAYYPHDLTPEIEANAKITVQRANELLTHLNGDVSVHAPVVRSGWRPKEVNDVTPHAAKNSKHITGQAIDLQDNTGSLKKWVMQNLDLCDQIGLWVESPEFTPTWLHIQIVAPRSGHRVFIP